MIWDMWIDSQASFKYKDAVSPVQDIEDINCKIVLSLQWDFLY